MATGKSQGTEEAISESPAEVVIGAVPESVPPEPEVVPTKEEKAAARSEARAVAKNATEVIAAGGPFRAKQDISFISRDGISCRITAGRTFTTDELEFDPVTMEIAE